MQETIEGINVGGHAGHDGAGVGSLKIAHGQAHQMRVRTDAEIVEQAFPGEGGENGGGDGERPGDEHNAKADQGDAPHGGFVSQGDTVVDGVADEGWDDQSGEHACGEEADDEDQ